MYIPPTTSKHASTEYGDVLDNMYEDALAMGLKTNTPQLNIVLVGDFNTHIANLTWGA